MNENRLSISNLILIIVIASLLLSNVFASSCKGVDYHTMVQVELINSAVGLLLKGV